MKIASKALVTIMLTTLLALSATGMVSAASTAATSDTNDKRLSRLYRKHDRKMELRAATLGITADELKTELQTKSYAKVLKDHGFKSEADFKIALLGKTKDELHRRGWSDEKINDYIGKRLDRLSQNASA